MEAFSRHLPAGFDGVFDWDWCLPCLKSRSGDGKGPMDFDAVIERNGQFLVFETKDPGKEIPEGQERTLRAAHALGQFTIMFIFGKDAPQFGQIWWAKSKRVDEFEGLDGAKALVLQWWKWADSICPL
jgi:hypothetical protein